MMLTDLALCAYNDIVGKARSLGILAGPFAML